MARAGYADGKTLTRGLAHDRSQFVFRTRLRLVTLEIEAEASSGFNDADVGVVRDNTKQLKFSPEWTGFSD